MEKIREKAVIALREPSLGPVFGIKGGAAGGGYAQVVPMEDINLHLPGICAITAAANNLLCAIIDNHMQQGNELGIDPRRILFKRCMDMNDRALRNCIVGLGGKVNGVPVKIISDHGGQRDHGHFMPLPPTLLDLKGRGWATSSWPIVMMVLRYTPDSLQVAGSMAALLKRCAETQPGTDAGEYTGSHAWRPFANIAHGCNSIRATKLALKLADYCITEAGFGSDLGAEKFLDIKCRYGGLTPACIVIVATMRALKYNAGVSKAETSIRIQKLFVRVWSIWKPMANMKSYGVPVVVAINRFLTDSDEEIAILSDFCEKNGVEFALSGSLCQRR